LKAQQIAVIGICAAVYAVIGRVTDLGLTFLGVAFYPAVVVPAVFAVLFGPWVGAFGGGIGIFIRDMLFHGNALLSLTVGVPANFLLFFIIGYVSGKDIDMRKMIVSVVVAATVITIGLLLPTFLLPTEFAGYTGLSTIDIVIVFVFTVALSMVAILAVSKKWAEWRSFAVGSVIGQALGAALLSISLWAYSQVFASPTGYIKSSIAATYVPIVFVWTFATEIPFILLVGPPIIKACQKAFPSLVQQPKTSKKGGEVA